MSLGLSPLGLVPLGLADFGAPPAAGGDEHNVVGAAATQPNTAGTGALTQDHVLAGAAATQQNTAPAAGIEQAHALAGSDATQGNAGSSAAATQEHALAGSTGTQQNTASTAGLTAPDTLNGEQGTQQNTGSAGAIGQTHVLGASTGTQTNSADSGAISIASDPRYARPESTLAPGPWTASAGEDLAAMISEPSADATTYIKATAPGSCEVAANPVEDPQTSSGQVVRYQAWSPTGDGLTVRLKQGAAVIASWTHAALPIEPTIYAQTLSAAECDSITNYADLRFQFVAG